MEKSDLMGRFDFDGAEGIAFWVGDSDTEPIAKVMFVELETLKAFIEHNLPGMFGSDNRTNEPTPEQVEAADAAFVEAFQIPQDGTTVDEVRKRAMRAALMAAAGAGKESDDRPEMSESSVVAYHEWRKALGWDRISDDEDTAARIAFYSGWNGALASRATVPDAATEKLERWKGDYFIQKRAADKAEAERDAEVAAKAWDRCLGEMPIDLDWKIYYGDSNPYRKAVQS